MAAPAAPVIALTRTVEVLVTNGDIYELLGTLRKNGHYRHRVVCGKLVGALGFADYRRARSSLRANRVGKVYLRLQLAELNQIASVCNKVAALRSLEASLDAAVNQLKREEA